MRNILFLVVLTTLVACSQEAEKQIITSAKEVPVKVIPTASEGAEATLFIEGMSCQRMCVSKIEKTMADLEGVESLEIDFNADRDVDICSVKFDQDVISEQEMIEAVQGIAGGVYKVKEVEVKKNVESAVSTQSTRSKKGTSVFRTQGKGKDHNFRIPNIFDVLKKLGGLS